MATNNCRDTVKVLDCGNDLDNQHKTVYDPFSVCLPFGRQLVYDGQGLRLKGSVTIADGKYGQIVVENGCITDALEQPVCEYTAQPCTPAATPCGDSGSGDVPLQPGADNILNYDASGRLGAQINYTTSTEGLLIYGHGTVSDPLTIEYTPGEAAKTYVQAGTAAVTVSGQGTADNPYNVSHKSSPLGAGTYGQYTIDEFGHVTGYEEQSLGVTSIIAGDGTVVTNAGTVYTVGLARQSTYGTFRMGGYDITTSGEGVVTGVSQVIDFPVDVDTQSFTLDPILNTLSFNAYGSLVGYTPREKEAACDQFADVFDAGRNSTSMTITTTKNAFFKITYRGRLTASAPGSTVYGYYPLTSPYSLYVGSRRLTAYAYYNSANAGIVEVVAVTDAYYAPGNYTISLQCSTEDFTFTDGAIMTVELIGRGNA